MTSVDYYNENAKDFIERTFNSDMSFLYKEFLQYIPKGGTLLDIGCGSGRDAKWFLEQGFNVYAHDASEKMVEHGKNILGERIKLCTFEEFKPEIFGKLLKFDGLWANACLLHVPENQLPKVITDYTRWLQPGGCFYMSFKHRSENHIKGSRHFTNMTKEKVERILNQCETLDIVKIFETGDVRDELKDESWINVIGVRHPI